MENKNKMISTMVGAETPDGPLLGVTKASSEVFFIGGGVMKDVESDDVLYRIFAEKRQENYLSMGIGALIIAIMVFALIVILNGCAFAESFVTEASYYTKESCIKEGTSGVYTASGERYDENALTCASWDFKFGQQLKVTNLANGKSVVVTVTDRGPSKNLYKRGRRIDLSAGAFRKLASIRDGIIKAVSVEAI